MPIFEYRCTSCGERFETLVTRSEHSEPHCPQCGGVRAERLLSAFAVGQSSREAAPPGPCGSADCACRRN